MEKKIALPEHPEIISNPNSCHVAVYTVPENIAKQGKRIERYHVGSFSEAVAEASKRNAEFKANN